MKTLASFMLRKSVPNSVSSAHTDTNFRTAERIKKASLSWMVIALRLVTVQVLAPVLSPFGRLNRDSWDLTFECKYEREHSLGLCHQD